MTSFQKALNSLIQLLALSAGRDKVCRVIQYYCKFLSTKYLDQYQTLVNQRNELMEKKNKSQSLMGAMSMTRKVLRFGPSLNLLKTIATNIDLLIHGKSAQQVHLLVLRTLSAFFLEVFFICDHYTWLFKVGLAKNQKLKARCQFLGAFAWFLDCITNFIKNICIYNSYTPEQKRDNSKALLLDTARVVADMPVAYSFSFPGSVNGKTVGLLGTFTSLVGIYQMWK